MMFEKFLRHKLDMRLKGRQRKKDEAAEIEDRYVTRKIKVKSPMDLIADEFNISEEYRGK